MSGSAHNPVDILKNLKGTELPVDIVLMEKELQLSQLLNLNLGTVLLFEIPASNPAVLSVNKTRVAHGDIVQVGENYGVKLTEMLQG